MKNIRIRNPAPSEVAAHGVTLQLLDGVPALVCNNSALNPLFYATDPYSDRPWLESVHHMYKSGIRVFQFLCPISSCWPKPPMPPDFSAIDAIVQSILKVAPEALFLPRVFLTTPDWWDDAHPQELIDYRARTPEYEWEGHADPLWRFELKTYHGPSNPSLASTVWRADAGKLLSEFVRYCCSKFPGHFIGFHPAYGSCGEWIDFGCYFQDQMGESDFSPPMLQSFRKYLTDKYAGDEELQRAWQDSSVAVANALPPTKREKVLTSFGSIREPGLSIKIRDWATHNSLVNYEAIIHFCEIVKSSSPYPVVTLVFSGYRNQVGASSYVHQHLQNHLCVLIESPHVDALCTPNAYEDRMKGVFSQGAAAAVARKKVFLIENDVRNAAAGGGNTFLRDTLYSLVTGSGNQWWYDFGWGWYLEDHQQRMVETLSKRVEGLHPGNWLSRAEVALVIDEESLCYFEGNVGYFKLWRQIINEILPSVGAPFDVITLREVLEGRPYKFYLFRQGFLANERVKARLREVGASAAWFYAAGMIRPEGTPDADSSATCDIQLRWNSAITSNQVSLINRQDLLTRGASKVPGPHDGDVRGIYGPLVFCDDPEIDALGMLEATNQCGMAIKRKGGRFDFWSAVPVLDPVLLRNLAIEAGVHVWADCGAQVFGSGSLKMIQPSNGTEVIVKLPADVSRVEDFLSGAEIPVENGKCRVAATSEKPACLHIKAG